jgi:hypothetical protein
MSVGYDAGEGYFECLIDAMVCTVDGGSFCAVVQTEETSSGVDHDRPLEIWLWRYN